MGHIGLESLRPAEAPQGRKRVGRGPGSGHGKTSGKGHKGQKARAGGVKGPAFEGGQLPLQRRLPKRGFTNAPFAREWRIVNVGLLERLPADAAATPESLREAGLIPKAGLPLKVLGSGEVLTARTVSAHAFSAGARAKIEAAGGRVVVLDGAPGASRTAAAGGDPEG
jgi:large subunit ribosomal protein L15